MLLPVLGDMPGDVLGEVLGDAPGEMVDGLEGEVLDGLDGDVLGVAEVGGVPVVLLLSVVPLELVPLELLLLEPCCASANGAANRVAAADAARMRDMRLDI